MVKTVLKKFQLSSTRGSVAVTSASEVNEADWSFGSNQHSTLAEKGGGSSVSTDFETITPQQWVCFWGWEKGDRYQLLETPRLRVGWTPGDDEMAIFRLSYGRISSQQWENHMQWKKRLTEASSGRSVPQLAPSSIVVKGDYYYSEVIRNPNREDSGYMTRVILTFIKHPPTCSVNACHETPSSPDD